MGCCASLRFGGHVDFSCEREIAELEEEVGA